MCLDYPLSDRKFPDDNAESKTLAQRDRLLTEKCLGNKINIQNYGKSFIQLKSQYNEIKNVKRDDLPSHHLLKQT